MLDQLQNLVGVADLVVVPGDDLDEGVGQSDTGISVEDGGAGVAQEVGGHDGLVGVTQNALQLALGSGLHGGADLLVLGGLGQVDGQVNDGDVQSGNTHGHTGQLAVQLGDDLADSLGGAGGGGDDVAGGSTAAAPILHGRTVNGLLGGGDGVNGVNWKKIMRERRLYHVSWEEYLLILQFVLAKKHTLTKAVDRLLHMTSDMAEVTKKMIGDCSKAALAASKKVIELDVVKQMKFPSHKVMFDRTARRFCLKEDEESLRQLMEIVDSSLHNISDYKSMRSEFLLNVILGIVSVASTFELLFQDSTMPFLTYFGFESSRMAAVLVAVVASVTVFAILLVVVKSVKEVIERIKTYL